MAVNVLVTGGAGYLGSILCEHLLNAGHRVIALDNQIYGQHSLFHLCAYPRFEFVFGDARDEKLMYGLVKEADVLIHSKEFAQNLLNDLNKIKIQEHVPAVLTPSVPISRDFLTDKKILGQMASVSDERVFDTYLYLLKEFNGNTEGKLTLDFDNAAKSLGIGNMSVEDYRRQIHKVLLKLKDKYKLIKFESPKRNQNTEIRLQDTQPESSQEKINIPTLYWRYGWNQTLSFPAKVMYLINLSYTQRSLDGRFSVSRENISKTYVVSESFISQGNQELRRLNIVDIQYSDLENKSFDERSPSTYTLQDLYNPEDLKQQLKNLEQKYGKEKLDRAIHTAKIVYEERNIKTIETLIHLEDQYGIDTVDKAAKIISEKNTDNPKRSAGYLINTIKSIVIQK